MKRIRRISPRINDEIYDKIEKEAEKKGRTISSVAKDIIEEFYAPNKINKYQFLDDGCVLRDYLSEEEANIGKQYGEGFYCMKKAPNLIRLGSGIESAASKICAKCIIREGALEDSRILKEQREKGVTIQMPRCEKGGYVVDNLKNMYCPKIGKKRPVMEKEKDKDYKPCKVETRNNANCEYLKFGPVVSGLKEKDNR